MSDDTSEELAERVELLEQRVDALLRLATTTTQTAQRQDQLIAKLDEMVAALAAKANHGSGLPADLPKPAPALRVVEDKHGY